MRWTPVTLFGATLLSAACSARTSVPATIDPSIEPSVIASTALKATVRAVFSWSITDRDARFSGEGAARIQPPDRARLDLFGPRGETLFAAALVGSDQRMPPGPLAEMAARVMPPPTLMWSVLGVVKKPETAELKSAVRSGAQTTLQYESADESWTFTLFEGRLEKAEWLGPQQGRQTVEIKGHHARGIPARITYRDWREFRELNIELQQVHDAEAFPADTWLPGIR